MEGISVVVPVYNEEENVRECYAEIKEVLESFGREYEILFVDDGSKDSTLKELASISSSDRRVRAIEFRKNFGQTAAMAAGLDFSQYSVVVTMDGDLQNDPREIPQMVAKLEEGYDLVAGWRKNRQDKFINRKLPSMIANWIISKSTNVQLHDYGCSLKVMTSEIAKGIKLYGEMHRFIPALAAEMGADIVEVPVNHRARRFGTTKYGISRTIRVVLDLLTVKFLLGYSKRPIHLFGVMGVVSGAIGALLILLMTYQKFFSGISMGNRPLLSLSVMLVILGFQFLVFGLLAEVLARTYYESQDKSIYVVRKVFGQKDVSSKDDGETSWGYRAAN